MRFGNKGFLSMGLIIGFLVVVSLVYFMGTQKETQKLMIAQQDYLKKISISGGSGGTGSTPSAVTGKYGYDGIKPYVNFFFEDLGGTARSPTCYIYYDDQTGKTAWGDERAWTDDTGEYDTSSSASSGKAQKQFDAGKKLWMHCGLSSYQDVFLAYQVPLRGDITPGDAQDTNSGIVAGTFKMAAWDTDAWNTSAAIDMGYSGSFTAQEKNTEVSTMVTKNGKIQLSQVIITNVTDFGTGSANSLRRLDITFPGCGCTLNVYNYDTGLDNTKYDSTNLRKYDSNLFASAKACLKTCEWNQDEAPAIRITTKADDTYTANGNVLGRITLYDMEGNALINMAQITA